MVFLLQLKLGHFLPKVGYSHLLVYLTPPVYEQFIRHLLYQIQYI